MGKIKLQSRGNIKYSGFTLIEILVAMVILGISMVTVMQLFSGGLKSCQVSEDYTRAIFFAREKMEELLLSDEMLEGVSSGDIDNDFKWIIEISPFKLWEDDEDKIPIEVYLIAVEIQGQEKTGKSFKINTLKITHQKEL